MSQTPPSYLCFDRSTKRYFVHPSSPKKYLGYDVHEAIFKFRQYVEKLRGEEPKVVYTRKAVGLKRQYDDNRNLIKIEHPTFDLKHEFPEVEAIRFVREMILRDSAHAARKLGIPEIARLHSLPDPQPSMTLKEVHKLFTTQISPPTKEELRKVRQSWDKFSTSVKVKTLGEIDEDAFNRYKEFIRTQLESNWSPKTTRNNINKLITVLNFAIDRKQDKENAEAVRGLLRLLKKEIRKAKAPEGKKKSKPRPLSKAEWKTLITAAKGTRFEPMLMLALNTAYYFCDVGRLPLEAVNLEEKTIVFEREKTETARVAVLWDSTIGALKTWMKDNPHPKYVFPNEDGRIYTAQALRKAWRRWREANGLPKDFTFNRIRDSALTRAVQGGASEKNTMIVGGHQTDIQDHYIERNPLMVAEACRSIGDYYGYK